eukprot:198348_1
MILLYFLFICNCIYANPLNILLRGSGFWNGDKPPQNELNVEIYSFNNTDIKRNNTYNTLSSNSSIYILNNTHRNERIPFTVWQTWKNRNILKNNHLSAQIKKFQNSGFEYKFINNSKQQELFTNPKLTNINEYKIFNGNITKAYLMINPLNGASRADLWRYYVLWKFGGVYLDVDSGCSRLQTQVIMNTIHTYSKNASNMSLPFGIIAPEGNKMPLNRFDDNKIKNYYTKKFLILNWCLMFSPKHPFLEEVIRRITERILNHNLPQKNLNPHDFTVEMTGPAIWSRTVYDVIHNAHKYKTFEYHIDGTDFKTYKCSYDIGYGIKSNMYSHVIHYNKLDINSYIVAI